MHNNLIKLNYFANKPKHTWKRAEFPVKVTELPRYQPLCCSLSGITRQTREAMTRLPEYILVGDPRHNIICRCVCHTSDIKECNSVMINDNRKLVIENPVAPDVSRDVYVPKKPTRRNWSNNNNNSDDCGGSLRFTDETSGCNSHPVPVRYANVVINQNTELLRARSHIYFSLCWVISSLPIVPLILTCSALPFHNYRFIPLIFMFWCSVYFSLLLFTIEAKDSVFSSADKPSLNMIPSRLIVFIRCQHTFRFI